MSWVRVDCDVPMDARLAGSGHAWAWPAIIARAKAGSGRVSVRDVSPRVMAHLWGPSVEAWTAALEHLLAEGLLIVDGDGYIIDGWESTQRDNTGAERQRRARERQRHATSPDSADGHATSPDVTDCHVTSRDNSGRSRDVTDCHAYSTVQDRTVQDSTTSSSSSSVPPPPSEADEADEDLRTVVSAWLSTQLTPRGHVRVQATGHELDALRRTLATHGRERTLASIRRAADTAETASPKLALFLAIAERGVLEGPRPEARQGKSSRQVEIKANDDYWAEGREASRKAGGKIMTKVPGVGYVPTEELTPEHIAAVEAAGFFVL